MHVHTYLVCAAVQGAPLNAEKLDSSRFSSLSPDSIALMDALLFKFLAAPISAMRAVLLFFLPWLLITLTPTVSGILVPFRDFGFLLWRTEACQHGAHL